MSDPIRVLCVFASLGMGGAESLWMNVYRNLNRDRIQLDFVKHVDEEYPYEEEIKTLGGRVFRAPDYKVVNYACYKRWWHVFLKKHPEYGIVHGHYFTIANVYLSVARKLGRIAIAHSHANRNSIVHTKIKDFHTKRVERNSDVRLACSKEAGDWLFPNSDYSIINNGIDVDRFRFNSEGRKRIRTEYGLNESFVIGTIGRIEDQKNPEGVLTIFEECQKTKPDTRLLWVGDGSEKLKVENMIREKGLGHTVVMTGVREDIPDLLSAMDVFILPSKYEGLGIVLVEAQDNGMHCVASTRVPRESNVTGNVTFLSLTDIDGWAKEIIAAKDHREPDQTRIIREKGYDIQSVASKVAKMYINLDSARKMI